MSPEQSETETETNEDVETMGDIVIATLDNHHNAISTNTDAIKELFIIITKMTLRLLESDKIMEEHHTQIEMTLKMVETQHKHLVGINKNLDTKSELSELIVTMSDRLEKRIEVLEEKGSESQ